MRPRPVRDADGAASTSAGEGGEKSSKDRGRGRGAGKQGRPTGIIDMRLFVSVILAAAAVVKAVERAIRRQRSRSIPLSELRCLCELSFQQSAMCQDGSLPAGDLLATVSERSGKALADLSDEDVHQFLYFPGAMVVYGDEKAFMRNIGLHEDYSQGAGHLAAVERAGAAALTRTRSNQARSASASASASASGSEKGDAVPRANGASAGRDTDTSADAPAGTGGSTIIEEEHEPASSPSHDALPSLLEAYASAAASEQQPSQPGSPAAARPRRHSRPGETSGLSPVQQQQRPRARTSASWQDLLGAGVGAAGSADNGLAGGGPGPAPGAAPGAGAGGEKGGIIHHTPGPPRRSHSHAFSAAAARRAPRLLPPAAASLAKPAPSWTDRARAQLDAAPKFDVEAGAELSNFRQICSLQHANIVQILGATFLRGHPFILEEDSPGGDMQSLITGRSPTTMKLDGAAAIKLTEGIIRGLEFLHSRTPQIVANLTPKTVLLSKDRTAKVILPLVQRNARGEIIRMSPPAANGPWTAPEVLGGDPLTPETDIYALAVVMLELFTKKVAFEAEVLAEGLDSTLFRVLLEDLRPEIPEDGSVPFVFTQLIDACWDPEPERRPTARKAAQLHNFAKAAAEAETRAAAAAALGTGSGGGGRPSAGGAAAGGGDKQRRSSGEAAGRDSAYGRDSYGSYGGTPEAGTGPAGDATIILSGRQSGPRLGGALPKRRRSSVTSLLNTMLPEHVVAALCEGRKVPPEDFQDVTVVFIDVVGYTTICSELTPAEVTDLLERLFREFDALAQRHGVLKIDTIGDAFIAAAGIHRCDEKHALSAARFAFEAAREAARVPISIIDPSLGNLNVRVGMSSGPVTATVVGDMRPKYTLLGNTVNIAARMETNSEAGRVLLSPAAKGALKKVAPHVRLVSAGVLPIKGAPEPLECFFLDTEGDAPEALLGATGANGWTAAHI